MFQLCPGRHDRMFILLSGFFLLLTLSTAVSAEDPPSPGFYGMGDLPGGSFSSQAWGVSADGSVVVGYSNSASGIEAFRWTSATGLVGLGDLPGGGFYSQAYGVSADGSVVVGHSNSANGTEAFIWNEDQGMRPLKQVLTDDYGYDLTGWTLSLAYGISADGKTIVGYGANPSGQTEAWLARLNDSDGDGIVDAFDNCPDVANANQDDGDQDEIGDACEVFGDITGDGVVDVDDLVAVLAGFGGDFSAYTQEQIDQYPCTGSNGAIDVDDLLAVLGAMAGEPSPCP